MCKLLFGVVLHAIVRLAHDVGLLPRGDPNGMPEFVREDVVVDLAVVEENMDLDQRARPRRGRTWNGEARP